MSQRQIHGIPGGGLHIYGSALESELVELESSSFELFESELFKTAFVFSLGFSLALQLL